MPSENCCIVNCGNSKKKVFCKHISWMPVTFTKMKSLIVTFHDFLLSFMHILVIFNTSKKSIFKKKASILLKNTLKPSLFRKR